MSIPSKDLLKTGLFSPVTIISLITSAFYVGGYYHQKGFISAFETSQRVLTIGFYEALVKGLELWYEPFLKILITLFVLYSFFAFVYMIYEWNYVQKKIISPLQSYLNKKKRKEKINCSQKTTPNNQSSESDFLDPFYLWIIVYFFVGMVFLDGFSSHASQKGERKASNIKWQYLMALNTRMQDIQMQYPIDTKKIHFNNSEKTLTGVVIEKTANFTIVFDTSGTQLLSNSTIENMEVQTKSLPKSRKIHPDSCFVRQAR